MVVHRSDPQKHQGEREEKGEGFFSRERKGLFFEDEGKKTNDSNDAEDAIRGDVEKIGDGEVGALVCKVVVAKVLSDCRKLK